MVSRRGFLKTLGLGAAAVIASPLLSPPKLALAQPSAPLFVPSQNLEMGVPRRILTATEVPLGSYMPPRSSPTTEERLRGQTIPMMLLQSEVLLEFRDQYQYGNPKMPAGTTVMVDARTATRWLSRGIAAPAPSAPIEMQREYAARRLRRQQDAAQRYYDGYTLPVYRA